MGITIKILGHPIYPHDIGFAADLLALSSAFDLFYIATGQSDLASTAFWIMSSGLIVGSVAMVGGWLGWRSIPAGTRAQRIGC